MSERARMPLAVALLAACGSVAIAAAAPETPEETLRRSDISSLSPESFRARLRIVGRDSPPLSLEVWRAGDSRILVRFLDSKDRGKYLLRRDDTLYFLSPRAKDAVKLNPSYRLGAGASLDEMLGTRYSRDYAIETVREADDGVLVFELKARTENAPHARVRYFVRRDLHRPLRAEFLAPSGKLTASVEFREWEEGAHPRPRRLRIDDALRPKESVDVEIDEVQERPVPEGLFDRTDATERRKLEAREP